MFLRSLTQTLARQSVTSEAVVTAASSATLPLSQKNTSSVRSFHSTSSTPYAGAVGSTASVLTASAASAASPSLLVQLIGERVLQEEHKDVLRSCEQVYEDDSLRMTWTELKKYADAISCGLYEGRVRPGHRMGLQMKNDAETLFSFLACSQLGVESVFLPPVASAGARLESERLAELQQAQQASKPAVKDRSDEGYAPVHDVTPAVPSHLTAYAVRPSPVCPSLRLESTYALEAAQLRGVMIAPHHCTMWRKIIPELALSLVEGEAPHSPTHPQFKVPVQIGFEYERQFYNLMHILVHHPSRNPLNRIVPTLQPDQVAATYWNHDHGVQFTQQTTRTVGEATAHQLKLTRDSRVCVAAPMHTSTALSSCLATLAARGVLILPSLELDPATIVENARGDVADTLVLTESNVDAVLSAAAKAKNRNGHAISRVVVTRDAANSSSPALDWSQVRTRASDLLGTSELVLASGTEGTFGACLYSGSGEGSLGKPLSGAAEVQVVDNAGKALKKGRGLLQVRGASVMHSVLGNASNAPVLGKDGWLSTGVAVEQHADGSFSSA